MRQFWNKYKRFALLALLPLLFFGNTLYEQVVDQEEPPTLNQLAELVQAEDLTEVRVKLISGHETQLTLVHQNEETHSFSISEETAQTYIEQLLERGIPITTSNQGWTLESIFSMFVSIALIGSIFLMQKRMGGFSNMGDALKPQKSNVTFKDVAGIDEVRGELEQLVSFLKDPKKMGNLGGQSPKGTLMVGPPGTGKTLIAKAVAGEAGVPFFAMSGSEFDEMFVGVGASRVRKLFSKAKANAPAIIFIDEIDSVGKKRAATDSKHAAQSLNQLLTEMDGFEGDTGVIVLAATNRVDDLDPALRRPGRFDREIQVPLPDIRGREAILDVTVKNRKVPLADSVDLSLVARGTTGFSGASLANLINEAALITTSEGRDALTMEDFDRAREKITMGMVRPQVISDEDKRITALHEAGHALIALKHHDVLDPIYKATIVPRGGALGMVVTLPEKDHVSVSRKKLLAQLEMMFGGRMAEKLLLEEGDVTTGASQDLQQIAQLANRMVTEWGFGKEDVSWLAFRHQADAVNGTLGKMMELAPETQANIDAEVKLLAAKQGKEAESFLHKNKGILEKLTAALLERETLTGAELQAEFLPLLKTT